MSVYVTRCPHCRTSFRVTSNMLELAHGAVRCGSCLQIFHASDHFIESAPYIGSDLNDVDKPDNNTNSTPSNSATNGSNTTDSNTTDSDNSDSDTTEKISKDNTDIDLASKPIGTLDVHHKQSSHEAFTLDISDSDDKTDTSVSSHTIQQNDTDKGLEQLESLLGVDSVSTHDDHSFSEDDIAQLSQGTKLDDHDILDSSAPLDDALSHSNQSATESNETQNLRDAADPTKRPAEDPTTDHLVAEENDITKATAPKQLDDETSISTAAISDHPAMEAKGTTDHGTTDHGTTDHGTTDHGITDHGTTDHSTTDHSTEDFDAESFAGEPVNVEPVNVKPSNADIIGDEAVTTASSSKSSNNKQADGLESYRENDVEKVASSNTNSAYSDHTDQPDQTSEMTGNASLSDDFDDILGDLANENINTRDSSLDFQLTSGDDGLPAEDVPAEDVPAELGISLDPPDSELQLHQQIGSESSDGLNAVLEAEKPDELGTAPAATGVDDVIRSDNSEHDSFNDNLVDDGRIKGTPAEVTPAEVTPKENISTDVDPLDELLGNLDEDTSHKGSLDDSIFAVEDETPKQEGSIFAAPAQSKIAQQNDTELDLDEFDLENARIGDDFLDDKAPLFSPPAYKTPQLDDTNTNHLHGESDPKLSQPAQKEPDEYWNQNVEINDSSETIKAPNKQPDGDDSQLNHQTTEQHKQNSSIDWLDFNDDSVSDFEHFDTDVHSDLLDTSSQLGNDDHNLQLNDRTSHPVERSAQWLWGVGSLIALITIVAQFGYWSFDDLARSPLWRPYYQYVCQYTGCALPTTQNTDLIEAQHVVVRPHTDIKEALIIDALLVNLADWQQPFPDLVLEFRNINETPIAARQFSPKEYLKGDLINNLKGDEKPQMPSEVQVHVAIEIMNPGEAAVSYQLSPTQNTKF